MYFCFFCSRMNFHKKRLTFKTFNPSKTFRRLIPFHFYTYIITSLRHFIIKNWLIKTPGFITLRFYIGELSVTVFTLIQSQRLALLFFSVAFVLWFVYTHTARCVEERKRLTAVCVWYSVILNKFSLTILISHDNTLLLNSSKRNTFFLIS